MLVGRKIIVNSQINAEDNFTREEYTDDGNSVTEPGLMGLAYAMASSSSGQSMNSVLPSLNLKRASNGDLCKTPGSAVFILRGPSTDRSGDV